MKMAEHKQKKSEINSDTIVGVQVVADIFQVSPRRVGQMVQEGIIPRFKNGSYKLVETIQKYIDYLAKREEEKNVNSVKKESESEKLKLERIKRQKAELEFNLMKNELHKSEDVKMLYTGMILAFKSKMLAIPVKLSPRLVGVKDVVTIQDMLNEEVVRALQELSEYDAADFAKVEDNSE